MQGNKPTSADPHAKAAGAYDQHAQTNTPDQRELEARVLLKATKFMQDLYDNWDSSTTEIIRETLQYNRQIWMMFYDTAIENPEGDRPNDLRSNIINLANFVFKREMEIVTSPSKDKLDVLIGINRDIAAGLMTNAKNSKDAQAQTSTSPEASESQTDISG